MTKEVTINKEQGLYVIPCGSGYTCFGFDNCEKAIAKVAAWLKVPAPVGEPATLERYAQYQALMSEGAAHNAKTGERCNAELTPQLIGLEGKRVEVITPSGEKSRFYVGKSCGWMPIHLEIKTRASTGGGSVYVPEGSTVRVVGSR